MVKGKNTVLTLILCIAVMLTMMPTIVLAADTEPVIYNLWVGGVRVTSDNMRGDGWTYEGGAEGGTLTLTYATITGTYDSSNIYSWQDEGLTVKLEGNNVLKASGNRSYGIRTEGRGPLTITGTGFLSINAAEDAVHSSGPVIFDNTNVRAESDYRCINCNISSGDDSNYIEVNGGKVELVSKGYGLFCGMLKTSKDAELTVKSEGVCLEVSGAEIKDSTVDLESGAGVGTEAEALTASKHGVTISNSTFSAKSARDVAVLCTASGSELVIDGSRVTAVTESNNPAIRANSISINEGSGSIKTYVEARTNSTSRPAVFTNAANGITLGNGLDISKPDKGSVDGYEFDNKSGTTVKDKEGNIASHVIIESHDLDLIKGSSPTCAAEGASDYYTCSICGKFFSDAEGKNEIEENGWIIPADTDAHDWDAGRITKEATEKAEGVKTFTCKNCGATKTEPIPATGSKQAAKVSGTLLAGMSAKGSRSLVISWTKVSNADGYDVFLTKCGEKKAKLARTIKGNKIFRWTKKSLKRKTGYKAVVKAWVMKNGRKTYVQASPEAHAYTSGGTKRFTNPKKVTVKKTNVSLKAGKTYKIKASVTKLQKGKKLMPAEHAPKLRYVSSNKKIAAVSKSGKIKAKSKGSCKIYVIAVNGASKTIKVTVK